MGRQAARLAPAIWVGSCYRHYVTVTNLMCRRAAADRAAGRIPHCRIVVEAVVRRCHIVMATAVRHSQLVVESETDSHRCDAGWRLAARLSCRVHHCQLVVENRAFPDSSHVFVDYSHLFVDRTKIGQVRALSSDATRSGFMPISDIMSGKSRRVHQMNQLHLNHALPIHRGAGLRRVGSL
jgi:hypothetical protein